MTYKEMQASMDWALQQTCNLKAKLNELTQQLDKAKGLIAAIQTAFLISGKDDAKAGALVRGLLEKQS